MTIENWLKNAKIKLADCGIKSSNLDADLILSYSIKKNRSFLRSHPENIIPINNLKRAESLLDRRLKREPLAYIFGYKEFYGRKFLIDKNVLIPRPESESLIEICKKLYNPNIHKNLIDVGCGSGCLGLTVKSEIPELNITLSDISQRALKIAEKNSKILNLKVSFKKRNLMKDFERNYDIIVANLPYVDKNWLDLSPELNFEPKLALFAEKKGLNLIYKLIEQTKDTLNKNGLLILEADPSQFKLIEEKATKIGLSKKTQYDYCIAFYKP